MKAGVVWAGGDREDAKLQDQNTPVLWTTDLGTLPAWLTQGRLALPMWLHRGLHMLAAGGWSKMPIKTPAWRQSQVLLLLAVSPAIIMNALAWNVT